jgi:hypothetical protein
MRSHSHRKAHAPRCLEHSCGLGDLSPEGRLLELGDRLADAGAGVRSSDRVGVEEMLDGVEVVKAWLAVL